MKSYPMTISELSNKYKNGQINLDPPYQRKPAWKTKQRKLLLSSLFNGVPIPSLIFHKYFDNKKKQEIYDVLDGKQRIETILHFIKLHKIKGESQLWVEFIDPHTNKKDTLFYKDISSKKVHKKYTNILEKFWGYELPIIEYEILTDFFGRNVASKEVFIRINSTGSPLKKHEIRHARYSGKFFKLGDELEKKYSKLFVNRWKILSTGDVERYLLHEFILELCTAIHLNSYSDRRTKLEELLSRHKWTRKDILKIKKVFIKIISWISAIFPKDSIMHTRFKNKSDFYSLFIVLVKFLNDGYVSDDGKSNKIAGNFLLGFSKQIQRLEPKIKAFDSPKLSSSERKLLSYVISTKQSTDDIKNREMRHSYLLSILKGGFILKKDAKRTFDPNVRDLLWTEITQKQKNPKCPNPLKNKKCKRYLTYLSGDLEMHLIRRHDHDRLSN